MPPFTIRFDQKLIFACLILLLLGLVMVASTSMTLAQRQFADSLHYFWRQLHYTGLASVGCKAARHTPF